jgi:transposase
LTRTEAFKAEAVAACLRPGVSTAAVALSRGLNANLLRLWLVEAERTGAPASSSSSLAENTGGFVPVPLSSAMTEAVIRLELRCGAGTVSVQ